MTTDWVLYYYSWPAKRVWNSHNCTWDNMSTEIVSWLVIVLIKTQINHINCLAQTLWTEEPTCRYLNYAAPWTNVGLLFCRAQLHIPGSLYDPNLLHGECVMLITTTG